MSLVSNSPSTHQDPSSASPSSEMAVVLDRVTHVYPGPSGRSRRPAVVDVSLAVPEGRRLAIIGRSGSGKSTLLHLMAGIDTPTEGAVHLFGQRLDGLSDRGRTLLRRDRVGLVFQSFHLQSHLSVAENVALPDYIAGYSRTGTRARVQELLERVGLADRSDDTVEKLSGGEQQRVALCRALLRKPPLLLADEPTGNLDDETGRQVMELLFGLAEEDRRTLVFVTHSRDMAAAADEVLEIHSGRLHQS